MRGPLAGLFLLLAPSTLLADSGPRVAQAQLLPGAGTGVTLTQDGWETLTAVSGFVQREPEEGGRPGQRTDFRVAYDATTLYIRVHAFDTEPDKIATYLTRRDDNAPGDWLRVFIDSYHDRRTAYEFAVNPSGVKQDRYWFNDSNRDESWDAVWDVTVSRDSSGWLAEFRIPFSQLRFTPTPSASFGFAVMREIGRLNETSTWPLVPRSAPGFVSSFGDLDGLSMLGTPKRLEVLPYIVSDLTRQPAGDSPLARQSAGEATVGVDLKYSLTPGLTLTGTVNPDFGQVEADPAVVNLSAFETFFNERRPFFVEGAGNFNFGFDNGEMFYSRRIGRSPQGTGDLPSGDAIYTDAPPQTTILGAAKMTGRVGRFSMGALHAVTRREHAAVVDGLTQYERDVEPLTNYTVGRARREFANQSSFGFILTSTVRESNDALNFLPSSAVAGGTDFDWRFKRRYSLSGYLVGSNVRGDATAIDRIQQSSRHYFQRPDAAENRLDSTATSLAGWGGRVGFGKIAGQRVRFQSNFNLKSPGFEISDLGFFRRADDITVNNWLQIKNERPSGIFRSRYLNFNQYAHWNYDGDMLGSGGNVNAHGNFKNNWSVGGGFNFNQTYFDDRLSRGGPGGLFEDHNGTWFYINSDDRRTVSLQYNGSFFWDGHGSLVREYEPRVTIRPMPALSFGVGTRVATSVADTQWVNNVTDSKTHYVFGHLDQTTVSLTGRVNYTMKPTLSLQLYAEPFVSAGDYGAFKELVDGRNQTYENRYSPFAYTDNPDFNYRSFRTTNVVRWEYRPGSTLFVVWQQAREGSLSDGAFRFQRDFNDLFSLPGKNVFLVKLAYWLNY